MTNLDEFDERQAQHIPYSQDERDALMDTIIEKDKAIASLVGVIESLEVERNGLQIQVEKLTWEGRK